MRMVEDNHPSSWRCSLFVEDDRVIGAWRMLYLGDGGSPAPYITIDGELFVLTAVYAGRNASYRQIASSLVWAVES